MIFNAGKREMLSCLIGNSITTSLLIKLINKKFIRILAYHRVLDADQERYPFDEELISASSKSFETQMDFVSKHFNVITFKEMNEYRERGIEIPEKSLIITFDDGYEDNYSIAYPVLKKHSLKAVFFITTDYIESRQPFWFENIIYLGKKGLLGQIRNRIKDLLPESVLHGNDVEFARLLQTYLKHIENDKRIRILNEIDQWTGSDLPESQLNLVRTMTWRQIKELSDQGMEIGSHSLSHPILKNMDIKDIRNELAGSKIIIENRTGEKVYSFSYPGGNEKFAYSDKVLKESERSGYEWGISYISGVESRPIKNRYLLKRIKIERYMNIEWFRSMLMFPEIFMTNMPG